MKFLTRLIVGLMVFSSFAGLASATSYLPSADSSQYLPTVKIFPYASSYNGDLYAQSWGSGTLIDDRGTILTNNHVIQSINDTTKSSDAFQICLTKSNDTGNPVCEFTASLVATDSSKDLALLRMDGSDVSGASVNFGFYLPYSNASDYSVGDSSTVIGFPDTGGSTITYTSGLISGFVTEGATRYIKTDADISFGNSGGTAVDSKGNFFGIPTYIINSDSAQVIGYLFPLEDAVSWINSHVNDAVASADVFKQQLRAKILSYVKANKSGTYKNEYPAYEVSLADGWKFGSNLTALTQNNAYYYPGGQSLYIYDAASASSMPLDIVLYVQDYAYELTLDDVEYSMGFTTEVVTETESVSPMLGSAKLTKPLKKSKVGGGGYYAPVGDTGYTTERVELNGKYPAIKYTQSYPDWSYANGAMVTYVTYYVPYGNRLITISYDYEDGDLTNGGVADIDNIMGSFTMDMTKVVSSVKTSVESKDPVIKIKNTLADAYLSDYSYVYDGKNYFSASIGKKRDSSFYISLYTSDYYDPTYVGNFQKFKIETLKNAEDWGSVVAKGSLKLDGHNGFYYTDSYDGGYGYSSKTTFVFVEAGDNSYIGMTYGNSQDNFDKGLVDFKTVLKGITLDNGGTGMYTLPDFSVSGGGVVLGDIKNNVYEDSIRSLGRNMALGDKLPALFRPVDAMTRKDFLMWAVKDLPYDKKGDFDTYASTYKPCEAASCNFADVTGMDGKNYTSLYFDYAFSKGVIKGREADGKKYFDPERQIGMMEAFKIVFKLYGYTVWEAPSFIPWYLPYLELAYKNQLVPYAVTSVDALLNRGQGAYIVDRSATYSSGYCGSYDCPMPYMSGSMGQ